MTRSSAPLRRTGLLALTAVATLMLAGCANDEPRRITFATWKQAAPVPQAQLAEVPTHHAVVFPAAGDALSDAEREAMAMFLQRNRIVPGSRVTLSAAMPGSGDATLLGSRIAAVRSALAELGYYSAALPPGTSAGSELPADTIVVTARVLSVAAVSCPGYNTPVQLDLEYRPVLAPGCSQAVNLGLMVANPLDLQGQATLAPADGTAVLPSVERYRTGTVHPQHDASGNVPFRTDTKSGDE